LLKQGALKVYKGLGHGLCTLNADVVNADLLEFVKA
jgi:non-heme chloroperoxidase